MILYTMMPHDLIFPTDENDYGKQLTVTYDGIPLMVEKTENAEYRVIRVLSSDPNHFLHQKYAPGSKISF
ncbi:YlzJ-like family protein [Robertmurraya andreesenii]|uniref:Uncharacterized protein n=1 Tax=Anoxybacillus andreesenii TaxID=1325932 RepID=A0ABT9V723_9BACL|nr:YlzJ-like family protein [Robertmurraya andreesenii]MDQ0156756.1 hypothetical protein [Robertmurraya andreesenii]